MNTKYFPFVAGLLACLLLITILVVAVYKIMLVDLKIAQFNANARNRIISSQSRQLIVRSSAINNSTRQKVSLPDSVLGSVEIE